MYQNIKINKMLIVQKGKKINKRPGREKKKQATDNLSFRITLPACVARHVDISLRLIGFPIPSTNQITSYGRVVMLLSETTSVSRTTSPRVSYILSVHKIVLQCCNAKKTLQYQEKRKQPSTQQFCRICE